MIVLPYTVYAEEPLLLTKLEGDPNSSVSYNYIPGSLIRGALVGQYHSPKDDLLEDETAQRLFFDGTVRYLNAYPCTMQGERTLPAPLSWYHGKEAIETVYDLSRRRSKDVPTEAQKQRKYDFCWLKGDKVVFVKPKRQINVHTQRDREKGRALEGSGTVFQYEALLAGQAFRGAALLDDGALEQTVKDLLQGDHWLGASRTGGYGRVRIEVEKALSAKPGEILDEAADWEAGDRSVGPGRLVLTLLSDAIVRRADGSCAGTLELDWLPEPACAFKRVTVVGGFNNKWGLPLCQTQAMAAGSVFIYEPDQAPDSTELHTLVWKGVGERRIEGFGRVAVNWHAGYDELTTTVSEKPRVRPQPVTLSEDAAALLKRMIERLARRELDQKLAYQVQNTTVEKPYPSNAQLSRLRSVILNALPGGDVSRILAFLEALKPRARRQYEEARIKMAGETTDSLLDWIKARLQKSEKEFWGFLKVNREQLPKFDTTISPDLSEVVNEYRLRLVAGVLHNLTKLQE